MEFPDDKDEFICELEYFRHGQVLNTSEIEFFDGVMRENPQTWMAIASEAEINNFYSNLNAILSMAVLLYQNEDYQSLVVNALSGMHPAHQLRHFHEVEDVSDYRQEVITLLEKAVELKINGETEHIISREDVFWFFRTTRNRYLLSTLYLCVLKESFFLPYVDCVKSQISLYKFTLGFWQPFVDFDDNPSPYQVFWVDMMSRLVSTKLSFRKFSELVDDNNSDTEIPAA